VIPNALNLTIMRVAGAIEDEGSQVDRWPELGVCQRMTAEHMSAKDAKDAKGARLMTIPPFCVFRATT
jgi:hypothetical protein